MSSLKEEVQVTQEEDKLPEQIESEIDEQRLQLEKKSQEIENVNVKDLVEGQLLDERAIIEKIRQIPVLTKEDHVRIDELDRSKFRLWMMRVSQKDEFEIHSKKIKQTKKDGEIEYELDDKGVPLLEPKLFFYSPVTNYQKKIIKQLESISNLSASKFNQKNIDCLSMVVEGKKDTKEYWKAVEEREELQKIFDANSETLSKKIAEFRLGIKPHEFDHLVESELIRYLAVSAYKESVRNPQ